MQIVIDIPDEEYENVKKAGGCYYDFGKAILYGILLPKGHGDLVDRNDLSLMTVHLIDGTFVCDAPTIIEADTESEVEE